MMGACLGSGGASEASEDKTLDGGSTTGDCEGEWYLDVARQVASTTHTRSTVKAREGLEKLTCALLVDGQDQNPGFTFQSLEVVTTCGRTQPAASAEEFFRQLFGEIGYLVRTLKKRLVANWGPGAEWEESGLFDVWHGQLVRDTRVLDEFLGALRTSCPEPLRGPLFDAGPTFFLYYDFCMSPFADPYGWIPSVLATGGLPSDLSQGIAQFLAPPRPRIVEDVLVRLCDAHNCTDHDFLWSAEVTTGRCRGKRIISGGFHDKYTFHTWTISHFADGGFDLDADPYEVGHTHELDLFPARSTFYLCDWPRGKRNDAARFFLRLY